MSRLVLHHHFASAPSRLAPLVAWTVLGLLTAAPAWAAFTFELVVNRNTVVPNSAATFTGFGLPALEGENVTFKANDSAAGRGVYKRVGGALSVVADTNTAIPGGTGNFTDFDDPSLDVSWVAFRGDGTLGQSGIYTDLGGLTRVADETTTVPGFGGTYSSFGLFPSMDDSRVAFWAIGDVNAERGVYRWDGSLTTVVDTDDAIPSGTGTFTSFLDPSLDGDNTAFVGSGSGQEGVYRNGPGGTALVANEDTVQPGQLLEFVDFAGFGVVSGARVGFLGVSGVPVRGFYQRNGSLTAVADTTVPIPEGTGDFSNFSFTNDVGPSLDCGATVFVGVGTGGQKGIYTNIGGTLTKVVDVDDSLGGLAVDNVFISREALSGNRIAFATNEPGGSSASLDAIWIATSDVDLCAVGTPQLPALTPVGLLALAATLAGAGVARRLRGARHAPRRRA